MQPLPRGIWWGTAYWDGKEGLHVLKAAHRLPALSLRRKESPDHELVWEEELAVGPSETSTPFCAQSELHITRHGQ